MLLNSSFQDIYKDRVFVISFYTHNSGFTAKLKIQGLPERSYEGKTWASREQVKSDVSNDARSEIDALP